MDSLEACFVERADDSVWQVRVQAIEGRILKAACSVPQYQGLFASKIARMRKIPSFLKFLGC